MLDDATDSILNAGKWSSCGFVATRSCPHIHDRTEPHLTKLTEKSEWACVFHFLSEFLAGIRRSEMIRKHYGKALYWPPDSIVWD